MNITVPLSYNESIRKVCLDEFQLNQLIQDSAAKISFFYPIALLSLALALDIIEPYLMSLVSRRIKENDKIYSGRFLRWDISIEFVDLLFFLRLARKTSILIAIVLLIVGLSGFELRVL